MYDILEKDDCYEIHLGLVTCARLRKGTANTEVIVMTALNLKDADPVRCGDYLAGVVQGLTHAVMAGPPPVESI